MSAKHILIVEDSAPMVLIYEECLKRQNYCTSFATTGTQALKMIDQELPDGILLDLNLPDMEGMDILKYIRSDDKPCAVIVITGQASLNTAVNAMQMGADDFVAKPFDPERLLASLANALEKKRLEKLVQTYEKQKRTHFSGFVGASQEMQSVYHMIESAAASNAPVMITGESGTGKEVAAQAIHSLSQRKTENLISLNCAAIPHDLLESEIFGHIKGSFTGATADRDGAAKKANNGTLFLDELTEMPLNLQSKLLRFIQTGQYSPVGSNQVYQTNIRFLCATNRDPFEAIRQGHLREDLYYRLSVIPLVIPALRERGDDIVLLAEYFLEKASQQENKLFRQFSDEAKNLLKQHTWPGNVRELENAIRHTVIMHQGETITAAMLEKVTSRRSHGLEQEPRLSDAGQFFNKPDDIQPMADMERLIIQRAIQVCDGNITDAAKRLDINPSTIHRKQKSW
jgi:two-component system repressor protein LuxO